MIGRLAALALCVVPPGDYDVEVDNDIYALHARADDLCATAREIIAEGVSEDDMVDTAVEVLTAKDTWMIATDEAVYYLRGLLAGCLR